MLTEKMSSSKKTFTPKHSDAKADTKLFNNLIKKTVKSSSLKRGKGK